MKNLILILFCFIGLFLSCEKSVSKTDLEGLWHLKLGDRNNDDIPFLIFENDSIQLIYQNSVTKYGNYEIIDNQLFGYFGTDTFSSMIEAFTNDSFYFLDKYYYHDSDKNNLNYYKKLENYEVNFIDVKTNTINHNPFWHYSFYLDRCASDSIKLHEQFIKYGDFIFLKGTGNNTTFYFRIFISEGSSVKDYKRLIYYINDTFLGSIRIIHLVTKQSNFTDFHYFKDDFSYWKDDFNNWQNNQLFPPPPAPPASFKNTRVYYNDALNIKINSSTDLEKLNQIKTGQKVLISYAADLDMKTYIQAQMILKPLFRIGNIRTEILGEVE